jgi:DNA-binding LytR/AlgR family response regulator
VIAEHLKMILIAQGFHHIKLAHDKERALLAIKTFEPELVLLDIRMKNQLDGIEIANEINEKFKIPFIFITAHSDTLMLSKALETKPAGYITKPFNQANVYAAINIAVANINEKAGGTLAIKDGFDLIKIEINSIFYVQSERNYIDIFFDQGKRSIRHSLEWFMQNVPEKQFMRIHRSFIVNISRVTKITGSTVLINN